MSEKKKPSEPLTIATRLIDAEHLERLGREHPSRVEEIKDYLRQFGPSTADLHRLEDALRHDRPLPVRTTSSTGRIEPRLSYR
ncbi:hypothetical protein ACFL59_05330 [Planctomycetota bacterium]